jgi:hypothetical protein
VKEKTREEKSKEDKAKEDVEAEKKKRLVTWNKPLLMACTYFDLGHCGYFENKDVEDIILFAVVNLSRAQVKKLVANVVSEKDKVR